MHLKLSKEVLVNIISHVIGAVERRHTLAILSHVKIEADSDQLVVTASDLEVEMVAHLALSEGECVEAGVTTLPARKLLDICKSLSNAAWIDLVVGDDQRCVLSSGQSRFVFGALAAQDFPLLYQESAQSIRISVAENKLKQLFEKTAFAMAVQDVRYYLTGTLLEVEESQLRAVATDGHRLALAETSCESGVDQVLQAILPRKAVAELQRLLSVEEQTLSLNIGRELLHVVIDVPQKNQTSLQIRFTSKLIDGKFPDYRRVLPRQQDKKAILAHDEFRQSLQRVSILSNEKLRGISLNFSNNQLQLCANNPEQDEAVEYMAIQYDADPLEMSFNAQYLLDVISVLDGDDVQLGLSEANQSTLVQDPSEPSHVYVVMPMRV